MHIVLISIPHIQSGGHIRSSRKCSNATSNKAAKTSISQGSSGETQGIAKVEQTFTKKKKKIEEDFCSTCV